MFKKSLPKHCSVFFFFFISIILMQPIHAQEVTYQSRHYSTKDGLSDHRVYSVLEHSGGFVFVGTMNGFNRFDGYRFYPIKIPNRDRFTNGSVDAYIKYLFELENGKILINYSFLGENTDQQADIYDPLSGTFEPVLVDTFDQEKTLIYLNNGEQIFYRGNPYGSLDYNWHKDDFNGNRFIIEKGNVRLVLKNKTKVNFTETWESITVPRLFGNDFSKTVYLASLNGLLKIDLHQAPFQTYLSKTSKNWEYHLSTRAISSIGNDQLLLSTETTPLKLLHQKTGEIQDLSIKDDKGALLKTLNIRGIHPINDSIVWLTSWDKEELFQLNLKNLIAKRYTRKHLEGWSLISSVMTKAGKILVVGTNPIPTNILYSLDTKTLEQKEIDFASKVLSHSKARVTCILETKNGNIWVGTMLGLFQFDLNTNTTVSAYFGKKSPHKISGDFPQHYILEANSILALHESPDGKIMIGTETGGLHILDPLTSEFELINTTNGLSNNTVCGILSGEKGYWISTYYGLSYYNQETGLIRNYYKESGLAHNEFNRLSSTIDEKGRYFLGGMNGFTSFIPQEVLDYDKPVKIMLSELSFFDNEGQQLIKRPDNLSADPIIRLPSNIRSCAIKVCLDDFKNTSSHSYSFRLQENSFFTKEINPWTNNGQNPNIRFDYLPAGNYALQIRGTSAQGVISEPFTIQLEVQEFFYKTTWFIVLVLIGLVGAGYAFYRYQLREALKLERLRTQLSSDLHDDVGSLLSGVAYQMELLEYSVDKKHQSLVQQIASSSRRAMSQMRDVVWAINIRNSTTQDLIERMQEFAREMLDPLEINYIFQTKNLSTKKELSAELRHNLLLIYKEFITNTIKHSEATQVDIHLSQKGKSIEMYIQDNGRGITNSEQNTTGQGLLNMRMRTEKIKGKLEFIKDQGFGIRVTVQGI